MAFVKFKIKKAYKSSRGALWFLTDKKVNKEIFVVM